MKRFRFYFACVALSLALSVTVNAQTILSVGDIIITGVFTDNPDAFTFVFLVDVEAGTEIIFTDKGWDRSKNSFIAEGENYVHYVASKNYSAGSHIVFERGESYGEGAFSSEFSYINGAASWESMALSAAGDQIIAFQGDTLTPDRFIFGITTSSTVWQTSMLPADNLNASGEEIAIWRLSNLPTDLVEGATAIAIGQSEYADDEYDNAYYIGPTSGTKEQIIMASSNAANWKGCMDDADYSPYTFDFDITRTASFTEIEKADIAINIFPNPATEAVNITSENKIAKVILYNINGQLIKIKNTNSNNISLPINYIDSGIFTLKVITESTVSNKTLIIK